MSSSGRKEVLDLFKKIRQRYENRFNKLIIYEQYKNQIDYFCFMKALNELPLPLQEIAMSISEDTMEDLERRYIQEHRMKNLQKKLKRLTSVFGSREVDLDNPY